MTLLGYFNSLRELGAARRLVEDEVGSRLAGLANRKRVRESERLFVNRKIATDVVESAPTWYRKPSAVSTWHSAKRNMWMWQLPRT
jgi:hypothetical protein